MYTTPCERALSAAASAAILALMISALVLGLRPEWVRSAPAALVAITFVSPTPPPPPPRQAARPALRAPVAAAPAPAGPRGRAAAVAAPPAPVILIPPLMVTVPVGGVGGAASGAGQVAGDAGSGSGGGGSGGTGNGGGNGYGAGVETPPEQIRGHLSPSDLHGGVLAPGTEGSVGVGYTVTVKGRVSACRVTKSSGIAALDALPCPLIEKRFRFRPALDRERRPVPATIVENHTWIEEPTK